MKRVMLGIVVLTLWAGDVTSASAAWNNVFQPTLFGCRKRETLYVAPVQYSQPVVVAQAAPAACPCGQQCTTCYTQRCYYQPVTTYESRSYYQQVTSYQTSYYYQPVTTYRQSCYYDPCTCCYQQVTVPQCSYELRAKSCPVTNWVQRCCQVPVTTYQKTCYWQPQTTCCNTTYGAPIPAACNGAPPNGQPYGQPPVMAPGTMPPAGAPLAPPVIDQNRQPGGPPDRRLSLPEYAWHVLPAAQTPQTTIPTGNAPPPPPVKLDRIVVGPDASVEGQVVRSDKTPRANARVLFVSAQYGADRQTVTANSAGRFQVSLASGGWLVYLQNPDGTTQYHSRIDLGNAQPARADDQPIIVDVKHSFIASHFSEAINRISFWAIPSRSTDLASTDESGRLANSAEHAGISVRTASSANLLKQEPFRADINSGQLRSFVLKPATGAFLGF